jgi:hypothetical protein
MKLEDGPAENSSSEAHPEREHPPERESEVFANSITNPHELSLFRSFRPSDSDDYYSAGLEPHRPYRFYIGLVLAIVLGGLGYMAWRSSQLGTQASHEAPPPPPVTSQTPGTPAPANTATPTPASNAQNAAANENARQGTAHRQAQSNDAAATKPGSPAKETTKAKAEGTQATPTKTTESASTPVAAANGTQELAVAERYLSGSRHDGAEAAKWLWKSVAKHNGVATVDLADLYLKGDGVSKNCDQARVLLDSAARKGVSGAGERLRNLQAFGCQ